MLDAMARFLGRHRVEMNRSIQATTYQDMPRGGKASGAIKGDRHKGFPVLRP